MTESQLTALQSTALHVREHIIRMSQGGGCFIGASLSCVELMVYCYARVIRGDRDGLGRDYLFLSKGHDVPALYGTFVEMGFLERERLAIHLLPAVSIYWLPTRNYPGGEF